MQLIFILCKTVITIAKMKNEIKIRVITKLKEIQSLNHSKNFLPQKNSFNAKCGNHDSLAYPMTSGVINHFVGEKNFLYGRRTTFL